MNLGGLTGMMEQPVMKRNEWRHDESESDPVADFK